MPETNELQLMLLMSSIGLLIAAPQFYIAWFKPTWHRRILRFHGWLFRWVPGMEARMNSRLEFWMTRVSYTFALAVLLFMFCYSVYGLYLRH